MTHIPLKLLTGLVTDVRNSMFDDYVVDKSQPMMIKDVHGSDLEETEFVLPLMSSWSRAIGGVSGSVCGGFHYQFRKEPQQGTGSASLALLPRMPKRSCELQLGGIKSLASIGAGKYLLNTERYAFICPRMSGGEHGWTHYLQLLPVAMDLLNRFAQQLATLPEEFNWREDVSHLYAA